MGVGVLDLPVGTEAGVRRWHITGFTRLVMLYRPTVDGVQLIRVLDTARDIEDLFHSDPH